MLLSGRAIQRRLGVERSCDRTGKETGNMADIVVGDQENFESALRRFNKKVTLDGILSETRRRAHYEKPSDRRRREKARMLRKLLKRKLRNEARLRERR
jgi:small subunit ribosomal protein S21